MIALIDSDIFMYYILPDKNIKDEQGNIIGKEEPKSFEVCCEMLDDFIQTILTSTESDSYILFLTKGRNFRYTIDLQYKANRTGLVKPAFFNELRDYMITKHNAIFHTDLEADDMLRITRNHFVDSIIVSPDKDLINLEGKHYNPKTNLFVETTKEQADLYFWKSMIIGDSSDGIKGIPGKGKAFVDKLLLNIDDEESYINLIHNEYINHFGLKEGINEFTKNFNLLYILDKPAYDFDPTTLKINYIESGQESLF